MSEPKQDAGCASATCNPRAATDATRSPRRCKRRSARGLERAALGDRAGACRLHERRLEALRIIASEDVGLGEPTIPVLIRTRYENWQEQRKADRHERHANARQGVSGAARPEPYLATCDTPHARMSPYWPGRSGPRDKIVRRAEP
jgi:hypothetical protein